MQSLEVLPVSDQEIALLRELVNQGVPFMVVGLSAAVILGADAVTKDIDLWFKTTSHPGLAKAAKNVGGTFIRRSDPPLFSGVGLDSIDVVYRCDGLDSFDIEFARGIDVNLAPDLVVKVLPIERVLASKRAANRPKDRAVIPALEAALAAIAATSE